MKKNSPIAWIFRLSALGISVLVAYFAWLLFDLSHPTVTRIPHTASRIYIVSEEIPPRRGVRRLLVESPDDVEFLMRLFGRSYDARFDTPICPFGGVCVSFVHDGERIDFYPAIDGCELIRYGRSRKLFAVTREEKHALTYLLRRYATRSPAT
jgi:hypothetical protein